MPTEADAVIDAIDRVRKRQNVPKVIHDIIDKYRVNQKSNAVQEYPLLHAIHQACEKLGM